MPKLSYEFPTITISRDLVPQRGLYATFLDTHRVMRRVYLEIAKVHNRTITGGKFAMSAGASTTVSSPDVASDSIIVLTPADAAAQALPVYVSSVSDGSFTVSVSGGTAAGGETFNWIGYR